MCTPHRLTTVPLFLPAPFLLQTSDLLPQKATRLHSESLASLPQNLSTPSVFPTWRLALSSVTGGCAGFSRSFHWTFLRAVPTPSLNKSHSPPTFQMSYLILHTLRSTHIKARARFLCAASSPPPFSLVFIPFHFAYRSSLDFPAYV